MRRSQIIYAILTLGLLAYGFYQAIYVAPTEQTMGDIQRIFYYHVPSAWTAGVMFFINFAASVVYLLRLSPGLANVSGKIGNAVAAISASDAVAASTASVTVFNPAPGGGTSNALLFRVH